MTAIHWMVMIDKKRLSTSCAMDIYLLINGTQEGPYSEEATRQSLAEGLIPSELPAWHEGLEGWQSVSQLLSADHPITINKAEEPQLQKVQEEVVKPPPLPLQQPSATTRASRKLQEGMSSAVRGIGQLALGGVKIAGGIADLLWILVKGRGYKKYIIIGAFVLLGVILFFMHGHNTDQSGSEANTSSVSWSADSPESMLNYVVQQIKSKGVGLGTVTYASYSVIGTDSDSGAFDGEITLSIHADAGSFGISSNFAGSSDTECHAYFSYDPTNHQWTAVKMTDADDKALDDDDSVLTTISQYFPEPYQIVQQSN